MKLSIGFRLVLVVALAAVAPVAGAAGGRGDPDWATFTVIKGTVTEIGEADGEGGLIVVTATVADPDRVHRLLLAPAVVLDEVGFHVEVGDSIRARVFMSEEGGPLKVQKVLNQTRSEMVRLRTLYRDPLWDASMHWHGMKGPHRRQGGGGPGEGQSPRRQGPGGGGPPP